MGWSILGGEGNFRIEMFNVNPLTFLIVDLDSPDKYMSVFLKLFHKFVLDGI